MKKAKWLILVFMLFCVVGLSACSITSDDIELSVRVNSDLKATATVTLSNINLYDFNYGSHLDRIDIYYAYSDEKKTSLASYKENNFSISASSIPDDAGDGRFSFKITDEENNAFLESGNNYWEKQVEFQLPAEASGKDVDYLVALIGSDIDTSWNTDIVASTVSSRIFTFKAVQPMYTVTIPAAVSLGQTASVSVDEGVYLGSDKYVCVKILGDSDGKFTLSQADDKLAYTISAKYPNDNKSYVLDSETLVVYGTSENSDTDKTAELTFNKPSDAAVKATKYAGTYSGTVTFGVSIEDDPSITIDKPSLFLNKGESARLTAVLGSLRADGSVTWSSSDESVAAVSSDGTVQAKSDNNTVSETVITATASNGRTAQCKVKVGIGRLVDISKLNGTYQAQNCDILTGTGNADTHITVADGANVTLRNCDITDIPNNPFHKWAGITFEGDGTIVLAGTNNVKGGYEEYPGIYVPENKTLTIEGSGSLEAGSNRWGAGIGGGYKISCGNIIINGGTVNATGGQDAAGIGGGYKISCGNITINGGTVNATGGQDAAGIGSGFGSSCGNIAISGGTVNATGGEDAAGIGSGFDSSSCKSISINGGTVNAIGGERAAGIGSGYYHSSCTSITIKKSVTKVEATKGTNAPNSIGAGKNSTCGTVTIETGANVIQK